MNLRVSCGLFLGVWLAQAADPPRIPAPLYTPSSVVNAASSKVEGLAPNTIATLYGKDLALVTRAVTADEIRGGMLPTVLIGTGVRLLVNRMQVPLYFVSPGQVNFLVPELLPGPVTLELSLDGRYAPAVMVQIKDSAPALFQMDPEFAIASHADGTVITRDSPASPGETIVLYATGLGITNPRVTVGQLAKIAAPLRRQADFYAQINGRNLPREDVFYAGLAPGFAGLYQINLKVPADVESNPEIRIGVGDASSPAEVRIHLKAGS